MRRGRCAPSSMSAAIVGIRSRRRRAGTARSSSARTTPGRTTSTALCAARRGCATNRASTAMQFPLVQAQVGHLGAVHLRQSRSRRAAALDACSASCRRSSRGPGCRCSRSSGARGASTIIEANWKVVVDNYLECYHCPVAHPGFTQLIDLNNYTIREYEYFSTQTGPAEGFAPGLYDASGGVADGFYAFLWPNFTVNIYPGPGNVSLNLFLPLGAGPDARDLRILLRGRGRRAGGARFCRVRPAGADGGHRPLRVRTARP